MVASSTVARSLDMSDVTRFQALFDEAREPTPFPPAPQPAPAAPRAADRQALREAPAGLSSTLETTTERALAKANEILSLPLDSRDSNFGNVLRAQSATLATVLGTQCRVDEARLRQQPADMLPKLLELMREEAAKLPPLVEETPLRQIDARALVNSTPLPGE